VLELLGSPNVESIQAQGQAIIQADVEDDVHVSLVFDSGQTAHIHSSWLWPHNQRSTTVIGSHKMMVYDEVAQRVTVYNKGINSDLSNRDEGSFIADIAHEQPLKRECRHFLDCLASRQRPLSDGWNGVAVVEILEIADRMMKAPLSHA
jgi:predicted dehydrogenase